MKTQNLYPAPALINIGDLKDNDPPVFEPVDEYLIPNAYINSNGYIFKNFKPVRQIISFRHRQTIRAKNVLASYLLKKKIKVLQPAISIMSGWNDNFYHFTLESLPKLFVLRKHIDTATIVFPKKLKPYHTGWIKILDLENITYLGDDEVVQTPLAVSANFTSRDLNHHNLIIPEFRKWVLEKIGLDDSAGHTKVFIGRKNPAHRRLLNLDKIRSALEEKGFVYLEMEDFNLENQIKIFARAEKIVCIHGAALTHLCFAKPHTQVIDLIHKDFHQWCYLKLAKILSINYTMLECSGDASGDERLPGYRDLEADENELLSIINLW